MSKDKKFVEHVKNLQGKADELMAGLPKDTPVFESYGRVTMQWVIHNVSPEYTGISKLDLDLDNYDQVKLVTNTAGIAILTLLEDVHTNILVPSKRQELLSMLDRMMETCAVVRNTINSHDWLPKFEGETASGAMNIPPTIARYLAKLLDVSDINLIREYDVRVLMQLSSPNLWDGVSPLVMVAASPKNETELIIEFLNRIHSGDAKIYLSVLKDEAERYVREHMKMEPVNAESAFKELQEELTSHEEVPASLLN